MPERDPTQGLVRRLDRIERKLDVLIAAEGLEDRLAEREEADRQERRIAREQTDEAFSRSYER